MEEILAHAQHMLVPDQWMSASGGHDPSKSLQDTTHQDIANDLHTSRGGVVGVCAGELPKPLLQAIDALAFMDLSARLKKNKVVLTLHTTHQDIATLHTPKGLSLQNAIHVLTTAQPGSHTHPSPTRTLPSIDWPSAIPPPTFPV